MAVARLSAIAGFVATSNVEAARHFGLRAAGTMAHSYIEAFPSEAGAFRAFAQDLPDRTTFLVDTYDTLAGVTTAIEVIRDLGLSGALGVRLDSGDLVALSREARRLLDEAGLPAVRIFASGGLDEPGPAGAEPLLVPAMRDGRRVMPPEGIDAARARLQSDLDSLPPEARALRRPEVPQVRVSPGLDALFREVAEGLSAPRLYVAGAEEIVDGVNDQCITTRDLCTYRGRIAPAQAESDEVEREKGLTDGKN